MSTRGIIGFRKNDTDKLTYNHSDSYPEGLGKNAVDFIKTTSTERMNRLYDNILMVDYRNEKNKPTLEIREKYKSLGTFNESVSTRKDTDWYCLLRELQGNLERCLEISEEIGMVHMLDDNNFIKDSLFCEYGYIINLDTNTLEFWRGFQTKPDEENRYGTERDGNYYPCKMIAEYSFDDIRNGDTDIVKDMYSLVYDEDDE